MFLVSVFAAQALDAGTLVYPSLGNVRPEEGTIEMWVFLEFGPAEPRERFENSFTMFRLETEPRNLFWLFWKKESRHSGPYATLRADGRPYVPFWAVEPVRGWKRGEKHHIAYAWKGARSWWILDGQSDEGSGEKRTQNAFPMSWTLDTGTSFRVGNGAGKVVIDDLRISSVARREDEVGYHSPGALRPDVFTLLLDTFDVSFKPDGVRQTSPAVMMPSATQRGGIPSPGTEFAPGVAGNGLRLWPH